MKEQWQELKETIIEIRDNNIFNEDVFGICRFLINYMGVLEKQMKEPCEYKPFTIDELKDEDTKKLFREFKNQRVIVTDRDCLPSATIIEPCEDAISRQAVLDLFAQNADTVRPYSQTWKEVKNLPPVTPKPKWIPTSERQPKKNGNYLALYRTSDGTDILEFMMVDHCNAGGGWLHEENGRKTYKKVIAWMPLPEPYTEESED